MHAATESPRRKAAWWALLWAALIVGAFLRIWQLGDQVLMDDEWHAIHKLLHAGMVGIASHFGQADYSIPLTLYYRALYDLGWLSEWPMRLPLLVAGLLLLAAPLAMRKLALPTRALWTGLLALSPVLIYLTRTARPYALTCILAGFAVLAFERWWRAEPHARRWATGYALATILAAWLHLLTLAFTLMPFLWFGLPALWRWLRAGQGRPVARLLVLGLATLLPMLALLLPPLVMDWQAMSGKASLGHMGWMAGWRTLRMAFGHAHAAPVLALLALGAYGGWRLWRQRGAWLAYLVFVAAAGVALIVLAEPKWVQNPGVLMRYALPVLPLLLLLTAEGLAALLLRLKVLGAGAAVLVLAGLFASGPLPSILYWPNQFMGHARFQFDPDLDYTRGVIGFEIDHIPDFYRQLAKLPPRSLTVGEGPWRLESYYNPLPWFQQLDRQYRKIVMTVPLCSRYEWGQYRPDRSGIDLRQFVHLGDLLAGQRHGIDILILHLQPWTDIGPMKRWPDMARCLALVEAKLGAPMYRDARIAAFDLRDR